MTNEGARSTPNRAWLHGAALAAMAAVYLAVVPFSITHLDLARDLGVALEIATGERFPMQGPVLAGSFHLGPIWYYLLALPLFATHSWLATVATIGVVSAVKFPLAYALGTRLVDRSFGLLWALMLLLPGWNTYETILLLHTSIVSTVTLALLWFVLRYAEDGATRHLVGGALLCALTLHAHPGTFALVFVAGVVLLACWLRHGMRWRAAALALLALALPFVPYLLDQVATGFPDIAGALSYLRSDNRVGRATAAGSVLWGTFVTGPQAVADAFFGGGASASRWFAVIYGALAVIAIVGLGRWLVRGVHRRLIGGGIALVLLLAVSVAAVRLTTPYYMTFMISVIGMGLFALGLRAAADLPALKPVVGALAGLVAGVSAVSAAAAATTLASGAYPFAFFPLFDVQATYVRGMPLPFMPAYAMAQSGDYLCARPRLTLHGAYAVHVLHGYALESVLRCDGRRPIIRLGGNSADGGVHVASLSRAMTDTLGLRPAARIGPLVLVPVAQVPDSSAGMIVPPPRVYPPTAPRYELPHTRMLAFEARGDEAVLVTDTHFAFSPEPRIEASIEGKRVDPAARDALMTAYTCAGCDAAATYRWTVSIDASAPERVDVVTVRRSAR